MFAGLYSYLDSHPPIDLCLTSKQLKEATCTMGAPGLTSIVVYSDVLLVHFLYVQCH